MWKAFARTAPPSIVQMQQHVAAELKAINDAPPTRRTLRKLPWYLVMGPRGSGKTAALRNSGLTFVHAPQAGEAQGGVWVSDKGVWVDTPGRYCETGAQRHEWLEFLRQLRRYRGARAVDGIILTVPLGALASPSHAFDSLRAPLLDVARILGVRPPATLLVTQTDHLEGFAETFADLHTTGMAQVWGFAMRRQAAHMGAAEIQGLCAQKFSDLIRNLRIFAVLKLHGRMDHTSDARAQIFLFPQRFTHAAAGLLRLVDTAFGLATLSQAPFLAGVYFSAVAPPRTMLAPQTTSPLLLGEAGMPETWQNAPPPQSFFLVDLFSQVLPAQRAPLLRYRGGAWYQRWRQYRTAALAALAAMFLGGWQTASWVLNQQLVDRAAGVCTALRVAPGEALPELATLRDLLTQLRDYGRAGAPWRLGLGLYQGDTLYPELSAYYVKRFEEAVVGPVLDADRESLAALWRHYQYTDGAPSGEDYAAHAAKLKLHLLLTAPRDAREPPAAAAPVAWVAATLTDTWAAGQPNEVSEAARGNLAALSTTYMELVQQRPALALPRHQETVSRTRAILNRVALHDALIEQLIDAAHAALPDLTLPTMLGGAVVPMRAQAVVPAAFTKAAWESIAQPWLQQQSAATDAWIYARHDLGPNDAARLAVALRSKYYARYIEAWQHFLDSLVFVQPRDAAAALAAVASLTRGEPSPYHRLFAVVAENTRLASGGGATPEGAAEPGMVASVLKKLRPDPHPATAPAQALGRPMRRSDYLDSADVETAFADFVSFGAAAPPTGDGGKVLLPLDVYQDQLIAVRNAFQLYLENPRDAEPLLKQTQTARSVALGMIDSRPDGAGVRPRLAALMLDPLKAISATMARGVRAQTGVSWCHSVVHPFHHLAHRYPFSKTGPDAPLADVLDFFRPNGGTLWSFFQAELARDVTQQGDRFAVDPRMNGTLTRAYTPHLISYLEAAHAVMRALFPPTYAADVVTEFDVRLPAVTELGPVSLQVGGQSVETTPGKPAAWQRMRWPGPEGTEGAKLVVDGGHGLKETLRQEGEWGLFRLLEQGKLRGDPRTGAFSVDWDLATQAATVSVEIRLLRRETPFFGAGRDGNATLLQLFRVKHLAPPAAIAQGAPACHVGG